MKKFIAFLLFFICLTPQSVLAAGTVIPGGEVIGMELSSDNLTVAGLHETLGANAKAAGVQAGDTLVAINGKAVHSLEDVQKILSACDKKLKVTLRRGDKEKTVTFDCAETPQGQRLGLYLKQSITGLGTVTWYDPETGSFGALGHGVSTPEGNLLHLRTGTVYSARVDKLRKGTPGDPGQLLGTLSQNEAVGLLEKNTPQGVFGKLTTHKQTPIAVGSREDVRTGAAVIRSTVNDDGVQEYSVEILKIYPTSPSAGRNMLLKVTDKRLLEATGGIVQGMSGSPIIQNGKLIGAVTHVLVNDPTTGYGIFIENMLNAAA